jgi:putative transposase
VDECLNETLFGTLGDARQTLEGWQEDYNWRSSIAVTAVAG